MKLVRITLRIRKSIAGWQYLNEEARRRDITITSLLRRIVDDAISKRQIDGILKDSQHLRKKRAGEHPYRRLQL